MKIGGSLITDKSQPFTWHDRNLSTIVTEIAAIKQFQPDLRLILLKGNCSFGHATKSLVPIFLKFVVLLTPQYHLIWVII
ncbi:MAG: hypothetical protein GDA43_25215 [Hormoscilla sp. SP5CHS1]|nr:hypothetical protein [Hormoscilla sp. SP12CHS1]MBC6456071.1 hypothetical protein [Hormoscilla sp. SP5CHS1]MBC6481595.1 hypothetical protein [Hormoscilla sp. GM7CHS1pb]